MLTSGVAGSIGLVFIALAPTEQSVWVTVSQVTVLVAGMYIVWASKNIVLDGQYVLREHDFVFAALLIYADPLRLLLVSVRRLTHCRLKPVSLTLGLQSIGGNEAPPVETGRSEVEF